MLDLKAYVNFDGKRLARIAAKGNAKAVVRAAAYLRKVARQKVRRRKHSSPPYSPPYAHSGIYKASILFGLNSDKSNAVIGPVRLSPCRLNASGEPIPKILEDGGMAALGMNANWIHKRAPRGLNSVSAIAGYFRGLGIGPAAYGNTPDQADSRVSSSDKKKKRKFGSHPKRFSPVLGKKIYLTYIKIKTQRQAEKVAKTVVDVFGYPATNRAIRIEPRPLMGPTLRENEGKILEFWRDIN